MFKRLFLVLFLFCSIVIASVPTQAFAADVNLFDFADNTTALEAAMKRAKRDANAVAAAEDTEDKDAPVQNGESGSNGSVNGPSIDDGNLGDGPVADAPEGDFVDPLEVDTEAHGGFLNFYPHFVEPGGKSNLYIPLYEGFFGKPEGLISKGENVLTITAYLEGVKIDEDNIVIEGHDNIETEVNGDTVVITCPDTRVEEAKKLVVVIPIEAPSTIGESEYRVRIETKAPGSESSVGYIVPLEVVETLPEDLAMPYKGVLDTSRQGWDLVYALTIGMVRSALSEEDFTPESWQAFTAEIDKIDAIFDDPEATLEEFSSAIEDFSNTAFDILVEIPATEEEQAEADAVLAEVDALNSSDYDEDAWAIFQARIDGQRESLTEPGAGGRTSRLVVEHLRNALDDLYQYGKAEDSGNDSNPGSGTGSGSGSGSSTGAGTGSAGGSGSGTGADSDTGSGDTSDDGSSEDSGNNAGSVNNGSSNTGTGTGTGSGNTTATLTGTASTSTGNTASTSTSTSSTPTTTTTDSTSKIPESKMPQTGTVGVVMPLTALGVATGAAFVLRKVREVK